MVLDLENAKSIYLHNKEVKQLKIGNTVIWEKQSMEQILLSSDKCILSFNDNESAVLTAQLADANGNPVSINGQSVDFVVTNDSLLYHYQDYSESMNNWEYVQDSACTFYWTNYNASATIKCSTYHDGAFPMYVIDLTGYDNGDFLKVTWDGNIIKVYANDTELNNVISFRPTAQLYETRNDYSESDIILFAPYCEDFCVYSGIVSTPVYEKYSAITDENGQCSVSYSSKGAGDIYAKAYVSSISSLQKQLIDYYKIDDATIDNTINYEITNGKLTFNKAGYYVQTVTGSYWSQAVVKNLNISNRIHIELDMKLVSGSNIQAGAGAIIDTENYIGLQTRIIKNNNTVELSKVKFKDTNGKITSATVSLSTNTWYKLVLEIDENTFVTKVYNESGTLLNAATGSKNDGDSDYLNSDENHAFIGCGWNSATVHWKNLKIKAL